MDTRYWIAINGDSCALCSIPLREPLVTPTPEKLFGFPTLKEAEEAQRICMTAQWRTRAVENRFQRCLQTPTVFSQSDEQNRFFSEADREGD